MKQKIIDINLNCYTACMYCHIFAILAIIYTKDPIFKILILLYILNDGLYHLDITSTYQKIWHFGIIVSIITYILIRIINVYNLDKKKRDSRPETPICISILVFYLISELLKHNITNGETVANHLCYEGIIHVIIWISIFALLVLVPEIREPIPTLQRRFPKFFKVFS